VPPVLIDARAAVRPELGGVERWARELAARLPLLHPDRYAVAAPPRVLVHRAGHAWEQIVLPARAARAQTRLLLAPANLAPLAWPRTVLVLHDAAALRHPGWYAPGYVAWQRALLPRLARRAVAVIVPSAFSRDEVVALLGADPTRVHVVPGGVGEAFRPGVDAAPARAALSLTRPYVLTVGSRTSRKNLAALGVAATRLAGDGIELVAVGGDRPQFRAEADVDGVRALGRVPDALLPGLYAGAEAFVLPSRYEGFGLPCLEAMAAGTPVVAARATALPEVCGEAALLADPDDPEEIAAALAAALADPEPLRRAGAEHAGGFTWDATSTAVDRVVGEALCEKRG